MLITLSILVTCFLILIVTLLVYSPGKSEPFLDKTGKPLAGSINKFNNILAVRQTFYPNFKKQHKLISYGEFLYPDSGFLHL